MTSYNGANSHNVESILASIRSTIGDERDPRLSQRAPMRTAAAASPAPREAALADEASEFELPAIFKPNHSHPSLGDARPNLLGRLSDALKPVAPVEADRSRTVIRFEPAAAGRMIEPPPPPPFTSAVRPAPEPQPAPFAKAAVEPMDVRREMTSFFDKRMAGMSSTPKPEPKPEPAPYLAPPQLTAFTSPPMLPPMLPDRADAQALGASIDDAAAQMMRPLLRQWLTDNMPKIVEKALRSEAGTELPRAPNDPHASVRKTLR